MNFEIEALEMSMLRNFYTTRHRLVTFLIRKGESHEA